jgi:hypothetical protein
MPTGFDVVVEGDAVPYEQQQTAALALSNGILALSDEVLASLAQTLRHELKQRGLF